jgi:hypothetical protein
MGLLTEVDNFELMEESRKALNKILREKEVKRDPLKVLSESLQKSSVGADFFDPYDALIWEGKVKVDVLYLDQLMSKLDESISESVQKAMVPYFRNIRQIYEFVNIKPEIYGRDVDFTILAESNEKRSQKVAKVIYEYLDTHFYSLTPEKRQSKYLENCKELSKELISEGVEPDQAISLGIKTSIVENLLTRIAFPFSTWSRIKYLTESEDYGIVFDQTELINLVNLFERNTYRIAKAIAMVI